LPIERGRPGPGLIANVAISKFCDGLPLYRQSVILGREGIEIDRATLADWLGEAGPRFRLRSRWNGQMRACRLVAGTSGCVDRPSRHAITPDPHQLWHPLTLVPVSP